MGFYYPLVGELYILKSDDFVFLNFLFSQELYISATSEVIFDELLIFKSDVFVFNIS